MAAVALATEALPRKLRVGLFAGAELQPRWLVEAFAKVAASGYGEIAVIAVDGHGDARAQPRPWYLDRKLFMRGADPDGMLELARYVPHQRKLAGAPGESLLPLDLDVVFALGAVDDTVLDGVARYGVWWFCADGMREVVRGEPVTRSALLARIAPGAEPRLVYQSWSCTDPVSIARNRARLLAKTSEFAWRALREAQRSGHGWLEQCKLQRPGELPPPGSSVGTMLRKWAVRSVEKALYREQWMLAFRRGGNGAIAPNLEGFTRIVPPRDRLWADPFVLQRDGRAFVFFEELTFRSNKGVISMLEIRPDGSWTAPVRVLERDYHLSYPFLIEHKGRLYMIPETAQNGTVEAYRCVDFPLKWERHATLLEGVRLVDATFHRAPDRWWMFANAAAPDWSFNDELHLFHAEDLFGNWKPHARNPVKSDVRCARPAGNLYWRNGALYRPAQIGAPRYGAGLSLNRVLRLTPHEYAERQVERVLPPAASGLLGIHTVNRSGDITVVDAFIRRLRPA